ncbi:hypothetical protein ACFL1E_03340 [Candidatus Omnitrophota bacterium]
MEKLMIATGLVIIASGIVIIKRILIFEKKGEIRNRTKFEYRTDSKAVSNFCGVGMIIIGTGIFILGIVLFFSE